MSSGSGSGSGTTWVVRRPGPPGPAPRVRGQSEDSRAPRRVPRAPSETPSRGRGGPPDGVRRGFCSCRGLWGRHAGCLGLFSFTTVGFNSCKRVHSAPKHAAAAALAPRGWRPWRVPGSGSLGHFLGRGGLLVKVECPSCWAGGSLLIPLFQKVSRGLGSGAEPFRNCVALWLRNCSALLCSSLGQMSSCVQTKTVAQSVSARGPGRSITTWAEGLGLAEAARGRRS